MMNTRRTALEQAILNHLGGPRSQLQRSTADFMYNLKAPMPLIGNALHSMRRRGLLRGVRHESWWTEGYFVMWSLP